MSIPNYAVIFISEDFKMGQWEQFPLMVSPPYRGGWV
jgi:hypothetical protein